MPAQTYTLTGDFADILGGEHDAVRATIETNLPPNLALSDFDADTIYLNGPVRLTLNPGLTFSQSLIATDATGTNIADDTLRYRVRVNYRDWSGAELTWNSGWFELTADADLSDKIGTGIAVTIDAAQAAVAALVQDAVEQAVEQHTPGIDLGSKSYDTTFTTTNTDLFSTAGDIAAIAISVVGQGRPIDVEFFAPKVQHSVAGESVNVSITVDGSPFSVYGSTLATVQTPAGLDDSPGLYARRRTLALLDGVTYVFGARIYGSAAGTCSLYGASFGPIELNVTSR